MTLTELQERRSTLDGQRASLAERHQAALNKLTVEPTQKTIAGASGLSSDMAALDQAISQLDSQIAAAVEAEHLAADEAARQAVIDEAQALATQMRECREAHDAAIIELTALLDQKLRTLADIRQHWRQTADKWRQFSADRMEPNGLHHKHGLLTDEARDMAVLERLAAAGVDIQSLLTQVDPWGYVETHYVAPIKSTPRDGRPSAETIPADAALDLIRKADKLAQVRPRPETE